jgi:hypothetical protein
MTAEFWCGKEGGPAKSSAEIVNRFATEPYMFPNEKRSFSGGSSSGPLIAWVLYCLLNAECPVMSYLSKLKACFKSKA